MYPSYLPASRANMISGVVQLADFSHIETLSIRSGFPNFLTSNPYPQACAAGKLSETQPSPPRLVGMRDIFDVSDLFDRKSLEWALR
jgi:hypothetical protein